MTGPAASSLPRDARRGADRVAGAWEPILGVCDVEIVTGPGWRAGAAPELLIEAPHGATRGRHFDATRRRLAGELPENLKEFFFVNTDVGSVECARWVARMATHPERFPELAADGDGSRPADRRPLAGVAILRGLVARTFVDLNRVLGDGPTASLHDGMTPALPGYVTHPEDVRTLTAMHQAYQAAAARAYERVCGAGGRALILHTYAPRSIRLERVDGGIVAALRRAYAPGVYAGWPRRPDVDLITETPDGERPGDEALVQALAERFAAAGLEVSENATYRLHPATLGYVHSTRHPGRVVGLELNRALLADPWIPFVEVAIGEQKARRLAAPIAAALLGTARAPSL